VEITTSLEMVRCHHGAQHIVHVVGHAPRQRADGVHLLRLAQLGLHAVALGHVLQDHQAAQLAAAPLNGRQGDGEHTLPALPHHHQLLLVAWRLLVAEQRGDLVVGRLRGVQRQQLPRRLVHHRHALVLVQQQDAVTGGLEDLQRRLLQGHVEEAGPGHR